MRDHALEAARAALAAISRDRVPEGQAAFASAAQELPALLRTNGLGQAAAYLKGKGKDTGAQELYRILNDWLCADGSRYQRPLVSGDLIASIRAASRAQYARATEAAWTLCEWLKPLAAAYLPKADRAQGRPGRLHRDSARGVGGRPGRGSGLPWYRSVPGGVGHAGLWLDKFCGVWRFGSSIDNKQRQAFLEETLAKYRDAAGETGGWLAAALDRRRELVVRLGGRTKTYQTTARLVTGLGMTHVLETGFLWHPTLAVPYLPGSSVKGMIRAWIDPDGGWADGTAWPDEEHLFGDIDEQGAGDLIVFDALPAHRPELELEILNVHYQPYYQRGEPPADYHEPEMVHFLVVKAGQEFEFAIAPRPGRTLGAAPPDEAEKELNHTFPLLDQAIAVLGAGAKTASGYGRFEPVAENKKVPRP